MQMFSEFQSVSYDNGYTANDYNGYTTSVDSSLLLHLASIKLYLHYTTSSCYLSKKWFIYLFCYFHVN